MCLQGAGLGHCAPSGATCRLTAPEGTRLQLLPERPPSFPGELLLTLQVSGQLSEPQRGPQHPLRGLCTPRAPSHPPHFFLTPARPEILSGGATPIPEPALLNNEPMSGDKLKSPHFGGFSGSPATARHLKRGKDSVLVTAGLGATALPLRCNMPSLC